MTRIQKLFSVFSMIVTLAAASGPVHAAAADAAGKYCFSETFNRPMNMNLDGSCPARATKPEGVNSCVVIEQQLGNLTIEERDNGAIYFNVAMIFPSEYSCELEGVAEKTGENTWRHTRVIEDDRTQMCELDITRNEDGRIVFGDPTGICSHHYCGAQAYFYNVGFPPESKGADCPGEE